MATKELKAKALNSALKLTEAYATGGNCSRPLHVELKNLYEEMLRLLQDIEKED